MPSVSSSAASSSPRSFVSKNTLPCWTPSKTNSAPRWAASSSSPAFLENWCGARLSFRLSVSSWLSLSVICWFLWMYKRNRMTRWSLFVSAILWYLCFFQLFIPAGSALSVILGISVELGVIVSTVTAVAYTLVGGLFAVAYVDIIQLVTVGLGLVSGIVSCRPRFYGPFGC